MKKSIVSGIGFLIAGLMVNYMLEKIGIELDFWVACLLFGIGIILIIWGFMPEKTKDWTKEQVGVIWPWGYKRLK